MPATSPVRRWLTLGAVGSAAAAITFAGVPAAFAADSYLSFSSNGASFAPSLTAPVFNQGVRLVPGSTTGGSIWVRNDGSEAAYLSAGAVSTSTDPELAGLLSVSGFADGFAAGSGLLPETGSCTDISQAWRLAPGQAVHMELTAALSTEAPNAARNRSAGFDLVFYLQAAEGPDAGPGACQALDGLSGGVPQNPGPGNGGNNDAGTTGSGGPGNGREGGAEPTNGNTGDRALFRAAGDNRGAAALAGVPATAAQPGQVPGSSLDFNTNVTPAENGRLIEAAPAGFQSTVEPIIRSLSGTLLIVMSVAFFAAAGLRLRSRSQ